MSDTRGWSKWRRFPDPRKHEYIVAPFGWGIYQLRNVVTGEFVCFGKGNNVAYRMTSLLPEPYGAGKRNNKEKRNYILEHLCDVEYRTKAHSTSEEAEDEERILKKSEKYIFPR